MYEREREEHVGSVVHHRLLAQDEISSPCCEGQLLSGIKYDESPPSAGKNPARRHGVFPFPRLNSGDFFVKNPLGRNEPEAGCLLLGSVAQK